MRPGALPEDGGGLTWVATGLRNCGGLALVCRPLQGGGGLYLMRLTI
jgi:hypothetical protein